MNRRLGAAAVAAALLLAALTGCGIPDETDVRVDGQVPTTLDYGSANGSGQVPPSRLASGDDPQQFAINFLKAAAGESNRAYDRVKDYLAPSTRGNLKVKQGSEVALNVVRLREDTPRIDGEENGTSYLVTIPVQQVGVLRSDGTLAPPVATAQQYTFTVGKAEFGNDADTKASVGLYVLDPPPVLLLSIDALKTYYGEQKIYFWNTDRTALVPDLRYLPLEVPAQRRATDVLGWLIGGPADWLASTAVPLPDGTERIGTVPQTGDRLEVNLSALPGPDEAVELNRLATQLAWSLPGLRGELELKIRDQSRMLVKVDDARTSDPVYKLTTSPQRYCVYAGAVRPLINVGEQQVPTPIAAEVNHDVAAAALARGGDGVLAALVTATQDGRRRLQVGTGPGSVTSFKQSGPYASMGRPVWLRSGDRAAPLGLVVADGHLYRFGLDDPGLSEVALPNVAGPVTSVGAALDGNRIAVTAGGGLYVAALTVDDGGPGISLGSARRLNTALRDPVAADWSSETQLVVAGVHPVTNRWAIYEVNVDGGLEATLDPDTGAKVSQLAAYPDNPLRPTADRWMYEANKVSWLVRFSTLERIGREQVSGQPESPPPAGAPNPTAPFFFY